jgi:hypothetical protein
MVFVMSRRVTCERAIATAGRSLGGRGAGESPRTVSDWLKADPGDLGSGLGFTRSDEFTSIPHKSPPLSIFMNNEQTETFDWLFVIYILIVCLCS